MNSQASQTPGASASCSHMSFTDSAAVPTVALLHLHLFPLSIANVHSFRTAPNMSDSRPVGRLPHLLRCHTFLPVSGIKTLGKFWDNGHAVFFYLTVLLHALRPVFFCVVVVVFVFLGFFFFIAMA